MRVVERGGDIFIVFSLISSAPTQPAMQTGAGRQQHIHTSWHCTQTTKADQVKYLQDWYEHFDKQVLCTK